MITIPIEFIESRRIFFNSMKNNDETIDEWFERIEILAKNCGFSHNLHLFLFNKFIAGLDDGNFIKVCAQSDELTLEQSLNVLNKRNNNFFENSHNTYTLGHEHEAANQNDPKLNEQFNLSVNLT